MAVTPEQIAGESESSQQSALFCWSATEAMNAVKQDGFSYSYYLALLHAIPNGDQRGDGTSKGAAIAGNRLKREGLRSGVPDIFLPVPVAVCCQPGYCERAAPEDVAHKWRCKDCDRYSGLYIEMKRPSLKREDDPLNGCSDDQLKWIAALREQGYRVEVCYTWIEAREVILSYLGLPSQLPAPWSVPSEILK
jgi:hypothetical protein